MKREWGVARMKWGSLWLPASGGNSVRDGGRRERGGHSREANVFIDGQQSENIKAHKVARLET